MSSDGGGVGSRVSIPSGARKTIQNIKEITGCHGDEEIYAMLKECSMDPNETTQKLLFEDSFHEVKRKRDRKKENISSKESVDAIWKSGVQGRGGRIGRGKYPSRNLSYDANGAKNPKPDNGSVANQGSHKVKTSITQNAADKSAPPTSISISGIANEPNKQAHVVSPHQTTSKMPLTINRQCFPEIEKPSSWLAAVSDSGVYTSVPDPIVEASLESSTTMKHHLESQEIYVEPTSNKAISLEESQSRPTSSSTATSGSRPPSSYSNRSQQSTGHKKGMEWKPKQTSTNNVHSTGRGVELQVPPVAEGPSPSNQALEEISSKLQKKLELHFSDGQHVIFPSHIRVPESERTVLSFGSFASTYVISSCVYGLDNSDSSLPNSKLSQKLEENVEESYLSNENGSLEVQGIDSSADPQSPGHIPENLSSGEDEISNISARQENDQSQQQPSFPTEGLQYSVVQTAPTDSTFGLIPPMVRRKIATLENSESQGHNSSPISGFFVQQPFDPSVNYYTQVYHTGANGDGCYYPLGAPEATTKYTTALSSQTDQSQKESENSITQHASGLAVATQTPALMQNSVAITQQSIPVFRQPTGVPLPHYPSNYMPYGPYFSPFYLSTHHVHPFVSNTTFPQQHPIAPIYPPVAAAASPIKYPVSQFKTGTNSTHSTHAGITAGYGSYNPAANTANSASNEDLTSSQFKENNVHLSAQQNEGSTVWIPAPGRDVPGLQVGSFYNLHPQGQHVTYTPSQAVHGALPGIFRPTQMPSATVGPLRQQSQTVAGAVEMVEQQTGIYPQPQQRPPINWGNNY